MIRTTSKDRLTNTWARAMWHYISMTLQSTRLLTHHDCRKYSKQLCTTVKSNFHSTKMALQLTSITASPVYNDPSTISILTSFCYSVGAEWRHVGGWSNRTHRHSLGQWPRQKKMNIWGLRWPSGQKFGYMRPGAMVWAKIRQICEAWFCPGKKKPKRGIFIWAEKLKVWSFGIRDI